MCHGAFYVAQFFFSVDPNVFSCALFYIFLFLLIYSSFVLCKNPSPIYVGVIRCFCGCLYMIVFLKLGNVGLD